MTDGGTYGTTMDKGQWRAVDAKAYGHVVKANLGPTCRTCDDENSWVETWWRGDVRRGSILFTIVGSRLTALL
jgi:hypothetical protein